MGDSITRRSNIKTKTSDLMCFRLESIKFRQNRINPSANLSTGSIQLIKNLNIERMICEEDIIRNKKIENLIMHIKENIFILDQRY